MATTINRGLYLITAHPPGGFEALFRIAEAAMNTGIALLQYRNKQDSFETRVAESLQLRGLCHHHRVPLIINDDIALAKHIHADGIHLGQADESLQQARQQLGKDSIIGITCHDSMELAKQAQRDGADYVAFGRFFASRTKPDARIADTEILAEAAGDLVLPIVAIGGVTAENAGALICRGADLVAVCADIFDAEDPADRVRQYGKLF